MKYSNCKLPGTKSCFCTVVAVGPWASGLLSHLQNEVNICSHSMCVMRLRVTETSMGWCEAEIVIIPSKKLAESLIRMVSD